MKMLSGSENMYLLQSNYMKPILSALLIVLLFGACKKDKQLTPPKTLIFGMYDAMCNRVPCGRYYLLQNGGLYDQDYFKVPTPAPLNQKSDSLYRIAAKLMNDFPAYEVQVEECYGKQPTTHNMAAIYSRIQPSQNASRPAGECGPGADIGRRHLARQSVWLAERAA